MSENIKDIAKRIKELREINKETIESLAKDLNLSVETIKEYESGNKDIPIGFLYQIASKFGADLTTLITGNEPRLVKYSIVRKDKAPSIERRKEYKYLDLSYNFINKKAETFLVTIEPKDNENENFYYHEGQEFDYVLEGTLGVNIDGNEIILNEGDSLYFNSGYKHRMRALNNKKVKFLAIIIS
ncbi:MAG TPA: cupin domain-containing protein [Spirochaetota bacterium]|nr:cupin domain-containing protein [Spirochaetota bacterium]HPP04337.1 cupin domain-containing protein [Spirochaetota bacterium]